MVATAGVNSMMLWTDLEGCELNGKWRLVRQVRSEGRTGWFEAKTLDGKPVTLIITETLNDEDELIERLRAAAKIHHPNVVAIEDAVVAHLEDTPVVIAATEPIEENLGDVLRERALGADEARQLMDSLLAGLAAIHGQGLVHGRMEAASVLATGDTIKLRSDCVHAAGANFAQVAAEDVRSLARIVVQSLTRRIPSGENDPVMQLVPEPMARAARRALGGRATVDEVAAVAGIRLVPPTAPVPARQVAAEPAKPAAAAPVEKRVTRVPEDAAPATALAPVQDVTAAAPPVIAPAAEAPQKQSSLEPKPIAATTVTAASPAPPIPVLKQEPVRPRPESSQPATLGRQTSLSFEDEEPESERRKATPWIILGAAALVIITAFVLYGMMHRKGTQPQSDTAAVPAAAAPVSAARPTAPRAVAALKPAASVPPASAGAGWRVVAYTYDREKEAQQKAESLQRQYPRLQFSVFTPKAHGHYLVTIGGIMSRADAEAARQKAVRMGLPHDTYAQNFH